MNESLGSPNDPDQPGVLASGASVCSAGADIDLQAEVKRIRIQLENLVQALQEFKSEMHQVCLERFSIMYMAVVDKGLITRDELDRLRVKAIHVADECLARARDS